MILATQCLIVSDAFLPAELGRECSGTQWRDAIWCFYRELCRACLLKFSLSPCLKGCLGGVIDNVSGATGSRGALKSGANLLVAAELCAVDRRRHLTERSRGPLEGPAASHLRGPQSGE